MTGRAAALCCALLFAAPAWAMRMRTSVAVEARSKDGKLESHAVQAR